MDFNESALDGFGEQALCQIPREDRGEKGDDVEPQRIFLSEIRKSQHGKSEPLFQFGLQTEPLHAENSRGAICEFSHSCSNDSRFKASALSSLNFGVRPKSYYAPRRRNHDAERRATKSANPRF